MVISAPSGLMSGWCYFPGSYHDSRCAAEIGLAQLTETIWAAQGPEEEPFRLLADGGFAISGSIITPYRRQGRITEDQEDFNRMLSSVRSTTEWSFGRMKVITFYMTVLTTRAPNPCVTEEV